MGETQCNVDPATGGRVCRDVFVPGAADTVPSASSSDAQILARWQQAMANAAAAASTSAASTPTVPATDALSSLSTSVSSALASLNLSGSTIVSFLPNWAVVLGIGAAGYYLTHHRPAARGRYR